MCYGYYILIIRKVYYKLSALKINGWYYVVLYTYSIFLYSYMMIFRVDNWRSKLNYQYTAHDPHEDTIGIYILILTKAGELI